MATMIAAERLGATEAKVLHYANTGDVTGDLSRVVGYGAVALVKAAAGAADRRGRRFRSARRSRRRCSRSPASRSRPRCGRASSTNASAGGMEALERERGAFVTLTRHGDLRGCIGYVSPLKPLYVTVRDVAMMAALEDRRFRPVDGG